MTKPPKTLGELLAWLEVPDSVGVIGPVTLRNILYGTDTEPGLVKRLDDTFFAQRMSTPDEMLGLLRSEIGEP